MDNGPFIHEVWGRGSNETQGLRTLLPTAFCMAFEGTRFLPWTPKATIGKFWVSSL